jgi:type VII secretion-associated serine protease mycosin
MAARERSHYVAYVRLRFSEMRLVTEAALMRRIAVLAAGLVLAAAAQAPAVAAAGSAAAPLRPAAAKPSPKPSKPSKPKPPPTQSVPTPVATEPGPSQQCPAADDASSRVKSVPWAQPALDWSSVWSMTEGRGVTVAVVDSGVDASPQLAGKVMAIDLTKTSFQDCSGDGHGTSIAGIIAASVEAQGNPFEGVAPEAKILSVKVNSQENGTIALLADGIHDAAALGAKVINVSVTTPSNNRELAAAVSFALRQGSVVVAAGGNDEGIEDCRGPCYPASYPGVLSVGAVAQDGSLPAFSNQRSHVDVTAPGVGVTSTVPGGYSVNSLSGTSYATAFVSGVVALVRSRYPNLSGAAVVRRIEETANGNAGPGTGDGLVNPLQAITAILPPAAAQSPAPTPKPQAVSVDQAPPPDLAAQRSALEVAAIALGLAGLVVIGALMIKGGRRRRWRAGNMPARAGDRTRELDRPDAG